MNFVTIGILALFASFLVYIGIIPSISDSYRTLKDKRFYHAFFGVTSIAVWLESIYAPDKLDIPYAIAGLCLWGISLFASFWKKEEHIGHIICTLLAIALGQTLTVIWTWETWGPWAIFPPVVLTLGAWLIKSLVRWNQTYWIEVLAVITIFGPIVKL